MRYPRIWLKLFSLLSAVLLLTGCLSTLNQEAAPPPQGVSASEFEIESSDSSDIRSAKKGIKLLLVGDHDAAQPHFAQSLKLNPSSSWLHFLNGLTYHLRSKAGDSSHLDFAKVGYQLALKHDDTNHWAAYQLGRIYFEQRDFARAQSAFFHAFSLDRENAEFARALAATSYLIGNLNLAAALIPAMADGEAEALQNLAVINAAVARSDLADGFFDQLSKKIGKDARAVRRTRQAMARWRSFHEAGPGIQLAQLGDTNPLSSTSKNEDGSSDDDSSYNSDSASDTDSADNSSDHAGTSSAASATAKMTMIDVVIIQSEEKAASRKGVNLLNGLTATLDGTAFGYTDTRTYNSGNTDSGFSGEVGNTRVRSFTIAPNLAISATYSLNIFNDNSDKSEILARPSLVALDGQPSEFFTGTVIHVELTAAAGSFSSVEPVKVGIKLVVTPTFLEDGRVELEVEAEHSFIEHTFDSVNFQNATQVTQTDLKANVSMNLGETLILGGLTEKASTTSSDGVPLLQDLPVVQYLFSQEDQTQKTRSVMILLTPRQPDLTDASASTAGAAAGSEKDRATASSRKAEMEAALAVGTDDNIVALEKALEASAAYLHFKTSDVSIGSWTSRNSLERRLRDAVDFLYY